MQGVTIGTIPSVLVPVHQSWELTPTDQGVLSTGSAGIGEMSKSVSNDKEPGSLTSRSRLAQPVPHQKTWNMKSWPN